MDEAIKKITIIINTPSAVRVKKHYYFIIIIIMKLEEERGLMKYCNSTTRLETKR